MLSNFALRVEYIKGSTNIVADGLSRWAYPTAGAQDLCGHGSKEDDEEVKRMAEEEEEVEVFVVRRVQEKKKSPVFEPKGEEVSAMLRPWAAEYEKSAWWGGVWKETHQDGATWPEGYNCAAKAKSTCTWAGAYACRRAWPISPYRSGMRECWGMLAEKRCGGLWSRGS